MVSSHERYIVAPVPRMGRPEEGSILPNDKFQARIQSLEKEMQEHEGELVLVAVRHWEPLGFDMPEESTPYGLYEDYYLGIIAPPYLKMEGYQIMVGARESVKFNARDPHLEIEKREGSINAWHAWQTNLDRDSKMEPYPSGIEKNKKLVEIVVGDKKVAEWIEKEVTEGRMPPYVLDLKDKKPEFFEKEKAHYFNANLLNNFLKMYQALGKTPSLSSQI